MAPDRNLGIAREIVIGILDGNEEAFKKLFQAYKEKLYAFGMATLGSHDEAIEIVQETFVRIWENRETLDPEKNLQAYLFQIARNLITDRIKKLSRSSEFSNDIVEKDYHAHGSAEAVMALDQIELLEGEAIRLMPPQRQKVYLLSRHENKSHKEIAVLLGVDVSSVRTHIKLALKTLREQLQDYLPTLFIFLLSSF